MELPELPGRLSFMEPFDILLGLLVGTHIVVDYLDAAAYLESRSQTYTSMLELCFKFIFFIEYCSIIGWKLGVTRFSSRFM